MKILGINDGHNSTACLLKNGKIEACISEERLSRIKNNPGFPALAIKKILEMTGTSPGEIDAVAFGFRTFCYPIDSVLLKEPRMLARFLSKLSRVVPGRILGSERLVAPYQKFGEFLRRNVQHSSYRKYFREIGLEKAEIFLVEHHEAHAAAAYHLCPWKNDGKRTLVITCDGEGDGVCATINIAEEGSIRRKITIPVYHSLGSMYSRTTAYLGMKPLDHEYKVMGLAPYADEDYSSRTYDAIKKFSAISKSNPLAFENTSGVWGSEFIKHMKNVLEGHRFDAVAFGIQKLAENVLSTWVSNAIDHFGISDICAGGGIFMNIKANKIISEMQNTGNFFVFPSCGDESVAIGAAIQAYGALYGKAPDIRPIGPIYFGPGYDVEAENFVNGLDKNKYEVEKHGDIDGVVGDLLVKNEIVARCSGRMEWGARALGNRSILANPSDYRMIRKLNNTIKFRDFWMPFTPTILKERCGDYLVNPKNIASPYMMMAFDTFDKTRNELVAAIHPADFTARPQILEETWNAGYFRILKSFEAETGIGGVLNTSFNLHGEPVVCTPSDAIHTMENSELKYLALGDYLVIKK